MNRTKEIAQLARELALTLINHSEVDSWCHGCGRSHAERIHEKTCKIMRAREFGLLNISEVLAMAQGHDRELRRRASIVNIHK